ncbi:MAG: hypothetical protein AB7I18_01820 [Candidatus Berkiella sp.]
MLKIQLVTILGILGCVGQSFANDIYHVDKVLDNGYYIINGLEWQPHANCKTLREGDKVSFLEGNPNGDCVTATILDINSRTNCKLWCKDSNY